MRDYKNKMFNYQISQIKKIWNLMIFMKRNKNSEKISILNKLKFLNKMN